MAISLTKWAFFVEAATTQQVFDMLKQSDLKVGSKYDKRYPGVIPTITNFLEGYVNQDDPAKKYWREVVAFIKNNNKIKKQLDTLDESIWYAKKNAPEMLESLTRNKELALNDAAKTVGLGQIIDYSVVIPIRQFFNRYDLIEKYKRKIDSSNGKSFIKSITEGIQYGIEQEEYDKLKKSVSPNSWNGEIVYSFDNGWNIWKIEGRDDINLEGNVADHCINDTKQPHCMNISSGNTSGYSLRDEDAVPWATIEMSNDMSTVYQVQGRHDHAVREPEQKMIEEWLTNSTQEGKDHPYMTKKPEGERTGIYDANSLDYPIPPDPDEDEGYIDPHNPDSWPRVGETREAGISFYVRNVNDLVGLGNTGTELVREYYYDDNINRIMSFSDFLDSFEVESEDSYAFLEYDRYNVTVSNMQEIIEQVNEIGISTRIPDYYTMTSLAFGLALAAQFGPGYNKNTIDDRNPYSLLISSWVDIIWDQFDDISDSPTTPSEIGRAFSLTNEAYESARIYPEWLKSIEPIVDLWMKYMSDITTEEEAQAFLEDVNNIFSPLVIDDFDDGLNELQPLYEDIESLIYPIGSAPSIIAENVKAQRSVQTYRPKYLIDQANIVLSDLSQVSNLIAGIIE